MPPMNPPVDIVLSFADADRHTTTALLHRVSAAGFNVRAGLGGPEEPPAPDARSAVAPTLLICLVSPAYLASSSIQDHELPELVRRSEARHAELAVVTWAGADVSSSALAYYPVLASANADPVGLESQTVVDAIVTAASELGRARAISPPKVIVACTWFDRGFIESEVAPTVAVNGFELHVGSFSNAEHEPEASVGDVTFVVVSADAIRSESLASRVKGLLDRAQPVAILRRDASDPGIIDSRLRGRLHVHLAAPTPQDRADLAAFLPFSAPGAVRLDRSSARHWRESIFSEQLRQVTRAHQPELAARLVSVAAPLIARRCVAYASETAQRDLGALRSSRYFGLMLALSSAATSAGITTPVVARQNVQALIELGQLDRAQAAAEALVQRLEPGTPEHAEATGLIGRIYKQRYMDAARAEPGTSPELMRGWLRDSVSAYCRGYEADPRRNLWHGVNALSLLDRAARDRVDVFPLAHTADPAPQVASLAGGILDAVAAAEQAGKLTHWDLATAAEASIVAGNTGDARQWLERYVKSDDVDAFSLASTARQFREVLGSPSRADQTLVELLTRASEERFSGNELMAARTSEPTESPESGRIPFVLRASDPSWTGEGVFGLRVLARVGDIVACQGTAESRRLLALDPGITAIEVSTPTQIWECSASVPFVGASSVHEGSPVEKGDQALVAIVDGGIDVRHRAFLDAAGKTRILSIWNQNDHGGTPPDGFTFGSEYDQAAIQRLLDDPASAAPGQAGAWGTPYGQRHGTHVASIAAGRRVEPNFHGGVAPEAGIIVVIPELGASLGYSVSHAAALAFIDRVAGKRPVVVNISGGQNCGGHDGCSLVEETFEAFTRLGTRAGRVVVKSAGNERDKGSHARIEIRSNTRQLLRWTVAPGCTTRQKIELWFSSGDELAFELKNPENDTTEWVGVRNSLRQTGGFPTGNGYDIEYTRRAEENGDSRCVVLIEPGSRPALDPGEWCLTIESRGILPDGGVIHAWLERGDKTWLRFLNHANEDMTLTLPATAKSVIAVGATTSRAPLFNPEFSSYGPTRDGRRKPELVAPGVGIVAAKAGTLDGVVAESGTSMAAPHVTGAIALLLSRMAKAGRQANAAQISKALTQTTRGRAERWHPGEGHGLLDVQAFLEAF